MKSTGMVRKVDELGRVVLPIELRRTLGVGQKDPLEIYIDGDKIILKKYTPNEERISVKNALKNFDKLTEEERKDFAERAVRLIG
jgi:transcriptional pleiotropic regulator of transition state genes